MIGARLYRALWADKVAEAGGSLVAYLAALAFGFARVRSDR